MFEQHKNEPQGKRRKKLNIFLISAIWYIPVIFTGTLFGTAAAGGKLDISGGTWLSWISTSVLLALIGFIVHIVRKRKAAKQAGIPPQEPPEAVAADALYEEERTSIDLKSIAPRNKAPGRPPSFYASIGLAVVCVLLTAALFQIRSINYQQENQILALRADSKWRQGFMDERNKIIKEHEGQINALTDQVEEQKYTILSDRLEIKNKDKVINELRPKAEFLDFAVTIIPYDARQKEMSHYYHKYNGCDAIRAFQRSDDFKFLIFNSEFATAEGFASCRACFQ